MRFHSSHAISWSIFLCSLWSKVKSYSNLWILPKKRRGLSTQPFWRKAELKAYRGVQFHTCPAQKLWVQEKITPQISAVSSQPPQLSNPPYLTSQVAPTALQHSSILICRAIPKCPTKNWSKSKTGCCGSCCFPISHQTLQNTVFPANPQ